MDLTTEFPSGYTLCKAQLFRQSVPSRIHSSRSQYNDRGKLTTWEVQQKQRPKHGAEQLIQAERRREHVGQAPLPAETSSPSRHKLLCPHSWMLHRKQLWFENHFYPVPEINTHIFQPIQPTEWKGLGQGGVKLCWRPVCVCVCNRRESCKASWMEKLVFEGTPKFQYKQWVAVGENAVKALLSPLLL